MSSNLSIESASTIRSK